MGVHLDAKWSGAKTFFASEGIIMLRASGQGKPVAGLKSTLFSGEGLVVDLTGPGRVLIQSRSTDQFLAWLIPQLPS